MGRIHWPAEYEPARTGVFVSNEIVIPAPPGPIWAWLIDAKRWPSWYVNSADVHLENPGAEVLGRDTCFRWKTFGVSLKSRVIEFVPQQRLAWDASALGIDAYHAWLLEPLPNGSTRVLTEETQKGFIARLGKLFVPSRMHRVHQIWLEALSVQATSGYPV